MDDGGPAAPRPLPASPPPPRAPSVSHTQPVAPPVQTAAPLVQPGPIPQFNCSHFEPEFAGKPNEDVEAHHHRTNNWMDTHAFLEGVKVQRFCLT